MTYPGANAHLLALQALQWVSPLHIDPFILFSDAGSEDHHLYMTQIRSQEAGSLNTHLKHLCNEYHGNISLISPAGPHLVIYCCRLVYSLVYHMISYRVTACKIRYHKNSIICYTYMLCVCTYIYIYIYIYYYFSSGRRARRGRRGRARPPRGAPRRPPSMT